MKCGLSPDYTVSCPGFRPIWLRIPPGPSRTIGQTALPDYWPEFPEPGEQMRARQKGMVILVMMIVVILGSAMLLVSGLNGNGWQRQADKVTVRALAQAKQGLKGFAAASQARPGELPCPDVDDDGIADYAGNLCAGLTGRLPWRTLGLGDLRDGRGERLWYAVSGNLRANNTTVINSNTIGQLALDGQGGFAAVIMAAHETLAGQMVRSAANRNNPRAYLEGDNATPGDNRFTARGAPPFNDRLLGLTTLEVMALVERRVAKEAANRLRDYYALNGYFPYAAGLGDGPNYYCDNGLRSGHPPLAIGTGFVPASGVDCAGQPGWNAPFPAWYVNNRWNEVIYYTVAAPCTAGSVRCNGSGSLITVNNLPAPNNDKAALLGTGGAPLGGQARPPLRTADLLDSGENADGDDIYENPAPGAASNDQFIVLTP